MADDVCGEPQLRSALGLYLAGALHDRERSLVETHLASCPQCLADAEMLGEAVAMLALLSPDDRRGLIDEFGVLPPGTEPTAEPPAEPGPAAQPRVSPSRPQLLPRAGSALTDDTQDQTKINTSPGGTRRSAARPGGATGPGRGTPGAARRRSRLLLAGVGLAVVVLLAVGGVLGNALIGNLRGDNAVTLVTNAQDTATGATLSVTVSQQEAAITLRATMDGLRTGEQYRFYVTDTAGQSWELAVVTGEDRPLEVGRACPVPLDRLDRFSVTASDGSLAVVAYVPRASASPTPN